MHRILPSGTQVVLRTERRCEDGSPKPPGSVGVVVRSPVDPHHSYRVRFADGRLSSCTRKHVAVLKEVQREGLDAPPELQAEHDLRQHVIYRCVVGSRAYGLDEESSDVDRRGVYLPPAEVHWSLFGVPEQLVDDERDECYWELQKFLQLALRANPTVLECLWTPLVEHAEPLAEELRSMRNRFLSRLVYQTYSGYVLSQFKKMQQDLRREGDPRWKHVMHLLRLLHCGIALLRSGTMELDVGEHREELLAIKRGEVTLTEAEARRRELQEELDRAHAATRLPERPDVAAANDFLVKARRSRVG